MDETNHAEQEILLEAGLLVGVFIEFHRLKGLKVHWSKN
jgi:hypothetical protein